MQSTADLCSLWCQVIGGSVQVTDVAAAGPPPVQYGQHSSNYVPDGAVEVRCLVGPGSQPANLTSRVVARCSVTSVSKCVRYAYMDPPAATQLIEAPLEAAIRKGWDPLPGSDPSSVHPLKVTLISSDDLAANKTKADSGAAGGARRSSIQGVQDSADVAALLEAAKSDNREEVVRLINEVGVAVDACVAQYRRTALHWACEGGLVELCTCLLEHHADVNFLDRTGASALHRAAWNDHPAIIELLLANGANKLQPDEDGETPLQGKLPRSIIC